MVSSYDKLTEAPGDKASAEQLKRLYHRYRLAGCHAAGCRVLEVACGSGIGLAYLASIADSVDGCDIDPANLSMAKEVCRGIENVSVKWGDAQELPYQDSRYDIVLLYEAIYYLPNAAKFVAEAHRVLKPDGKLVICTVNPQWQSFHPSPLAIRYYSTEELKYLLSPLFSSVKILGAFPVDSGGAKSKILNVAKRCAVALHLIPNTLEARARLKRVFFGKLQELPRRLEPGKVSYTEPTLLNPTFAQTGFKILYAIACKGNVPHEEKHILPPVCSENISRRTDKRSDEHFKRCLDVALAGFGLLVFAPLLVIVGLSIYLQDFGPILYRPQRVGRHKRLFRINKFRTMVPKADTIGGPTTSLRDSRITPVGHTLRRFKIDELPQLLNVLMGEMSLVGPRPEVLSEVEQYGKQWDDIFLVRPGMTDRASIKFRHEDEIVQASGIDDPHEAYKMLIQPHKLELQLRYARNHSVVEDLRIIMDTIKAVVGR